MPTMKFYISRFVNFVFSVSFSCARKRKIRQIRQYIIVCENRVPRTYRKVSIQLYNVDLNKLYLGV